MATRFYMAIGTKAIASAPIAVSSVWDQAPLGTPDVYGKLVTAPRSGVRGAAAILTGIDLPDPKGSTTVPWDIFGSQFISEPLLAQTLTGTFSMVMQAAESASTFNGWLQVVIRVVSGDGTIVRGTPFAGQVQAAVGGAGNSNYEFGVTGTMRKTRTLVNLALASTNIQAGDRLVVEVGARSSNAAATETAYLVGVHDLEEANDMLLRYDVPYTEGAGVQHRAWIEFSQDLLGILTQEQYRFNGGTLLNGSVALPFVDITGVDGLDNAPVRSSAQSLEGMDGGLVDAEFYDSRTIVIDGDIYASNVQLESYLDQLKKNFAPTHVPRPFVFKTDNGGERVVFANSLGLRYKKDTFRRLGRVPFQVTLLCPDSRIYTNLQEEKLLTVTSSATVDTVITAGGNRDTPWQATLVGPIGGTWSLTLSNQYGQCRFTDATTIAVNETVTIDSLTRSIIKSTITGDVNFRGEVSLSIGTWMPMAPDWNNFTVNVGASSTGIIMIAYRDAWE